MRYSHVIIIITTSLCVGSCTPPPASIVVTKWQYNEALPKFHWNAQGQPPWWLYTVDSLNRRLVREDVVEIGIQLKSGYYFYSRSVTASDDSLQVHDSARTWAVSIDSIRFIEIFNETAFTGKLWRSAVIGGFTSSLMLFGYLPPNPPEPNATSFGVAAAVGTTIGLFTVSRGSERIVIVTKADALSMDPRNLLKKYSAA